MTKYFLFSIFFISLIGCSNQEEKETTTTANWGYKVIHSNPLFTKSTSKQEIKIAIVDSGIKAEHIALQNKIVDSYNAIAPDQKATDDLGHGTAIAGIIGANMPDENMIGLAPNAKLYNVKVLNSQGKGDIETVIRGIKWCIDQKVDIINISFGFEANHFELEKIINKALENEIIVIAASGNTLGLRVDYPAKYDGVISVAALKPDLTRYSYSGKGKIDYSAPGKNIISTHSDGGFSEFNGTSFSAAFVTGTIAHLMGSSAENINSNNINSFLKPFVKDLGPNGFDEKYGHGLIQIN
ncbi:S8 family peptidase [Bacillus sp. N6]|uniref:S8 family peptidase n=1 Tax=Bacillus sp. N6 TaxID=127893 RepID=UPI00405755D5